MRVKRPQLPHGPKTFGNFSFVSKKSMFELFYLDPLLKQKLKQLFASICLST